MNSPSFPRISLTELVDRWEALLRQMEREAHFDAMDWEDASAAAERFEEEQRITLLGCGAHRCGFAWRPDQVVKLPLNDEGKAMNLLEAENYEVFGREGIDPLFAPVLEVDPDGAYIVMARTDYPGQGRDFDLRFELLDEQLHSLGFTDIHDENVGVLGGKLVAFDYGEPVRPLDPVAVMEIKRRLMR